MIQTNRENFTKYLEEIKKLNILVIGDIMIDRWEYYKSTRLSQEAPVPIVVPEKMEHILGGAANVAKNLDLLGVNTYLFSLLGTDKYSSMLVNDLIKKQTNIKFHYISDSRINTLKQRLIVDNQHFLRIDNENTTKIDNFSFTQFKLTLNNILNLQKFDAIILQDYDKGLLSENVISHILYICHSKNIKVYIDPKKNKTVDSCWLLKPNKKEFFDISGIEITKDNYFNLYDDIYEWMHEKSIKNLLITMSEDGMILYDYKNKVTKFDTKFISGNTVDVTGAGDICIALYTSLDLINDVSEYEKLFYTSLASQTAITKRGTSIFNLEEIQKYI